MKKLFLLSLCLILLTSAFSQNKIDSTKSKGIDTTNKPPAVVAIILPFQEWQALIQLIKSTDEKPSVINAWVNHIVESTKPIAVDNNIKDNKQPAKKALIISSISKNNSFCFNLGFILISKKVIGVKGIFPLNPFSFNSLKVILVFPELR